MRGCVRRRCHCSEFRMRSLVPPVQVHCWRYGSSPVIWRAHSPSWSTPIWCRGMGASHVGSIPTVQGCRWCRLVWVEDPYKSVFIISWKWYLTLHCSLPSIQDSVLSLACLDPAIDPFLQALIMCIPDIALTTTKFRHVAIIIYILWYGLSISYGPSPRQNLHT